MRMKKKGISSIIAELLLIVITVAIGTLVYSFASTAFGGFGAGFSNLVQGAGNQLAENLVVEQVYFFNNATTSTPPCGNPGGSFSQICATGDLFIRNTGENSLVISQIYVENVTGADLGDPVGPMAPSAPPTSKVDLTFRACVGGPPCSWSSNPGSWLPSTAVAGCSVTACIASLAPGQSATIKFYCVDPITPGNVYAFTLVTQRGNEFVVYEKA
jgi:flagellin-like protein